MVEPTIVEREPMTVVGLQAHYTGDDAIFQELWAEFGERWDEFEGLSATDEAFGVMSNVEMEPMAFDYLAGVATETTDDLPDDFVTVAVPGGTFATFETTLDSFMEDYESVTESWLSAADYDRREGMEYERYGPEYDAEDPAAPYEYYVPVAATEQSTTAQ